MDPISDGQVARNIRGLFEALEIFEGPRPRGRTQRKPSLLVPAQRAALQAYLDAHERVLEARAELGPEWQIDLELVQLDAEYQRLRSNLQYQSGIAPGIQHLSGPRSAASRLRAIQHLSERLSIPSKRRSGSVSAFSHDVAGTLSWTKKAAFRKITACAQRRAEVLGPALAAYHSFSTSRLDNAVASGPGGFGTAPASNDAWAENVVRIHRNGFAGTGFFVTSTLLVTAAHVVHTPGTPPPLPSELSVELNDGSSRRVLAVTPNPEWTSSKPTLDTAWLAVDSVDGLGLPLLWDFGNHVSTKIARYGYPASASDDGYGTGSVQRAGPTFITSDNALQIPAGASGCPLLFASNGVTRAVGIGTARSNVASTSATFIGLPLLHQLLPELSP